MHNWGIYMNFIYISQFEKYYSNEIKNQKKKLELLESCAEEARAVTFQNLTRSKYQIYS